MTSDSIETTDTTNTTATAIHPAFQQNTYLLRKKMKLALGGHFHIYDAQENLVLTSKQKAFKIKEDIRIYADEAHTQELLTITTPKVFDMSATYNVVDATTGEAVGGVKRKGMKSIIIDEWLFLSPDGQEIGKLVESNWVAAILSRWINLIPQSYAITDAAGATVASVNQRFNPMFLKYDMSIADQNPSIDRRLLIAAGVLLLGIEGRQG